MRTRLIGALGCLVVLSITGGCSGGGGQKPAIDAASEAAGGGGDGGDAAATDYDCQTIRNCVGLCDDGDQACVQMCIAKGTSQARTTFQALAACTLQSCPTGEFYCGCDQQCPLDASCRAETEACLAGAIDLICDQRCVGAN